MKCRRDRSLQIAERHAEAYNHRGAIILNECAQTLHDDQVLQQHDFWKMRSNLIAGFLNNLPMDRDHRRIYLRMKDLWIRRANYFRKKYECDRATALLRTMPVVEFVPPLEPIPNMGRFTTQTRDLSRAKMRQYMASLTKGFSIKRKTEQKLQELDYYRNCVSNMRKQEARLFELSRYHKNFVESKTREKQLENYIRNTNRGKKQRKVYVTQSFDIAKFLPHNLREDARGAVCLVEDCLILTKMLGSIREESTLEDILFAVANFIKLRSHDSLICSTKDSLKEYKDYFVSLYSLEVQSNDFKSFVHTARDTLNKFDEIKESAGFKKIRSFMNYVLANSLLQSCGLSMNKLGFTLVQQKLMEKKFPMGFDFYRCMLDTLLYMCEAGFQVLKTGQWEDIFHCGTTYEQWMVDSKSHLAAVSSIGIAMSEHEYLGKLDILIEQGKQIAQHASRMKDGDSKYILCKLAELSIAKEERVCKQNARSMRRQPLGIMFYSDSKVGKSTCMAIIKHFCAKIANLPTDDYYTYYVQPENNFQDGIENHIHTAIIDELAYRKPVAGQIDPSLSMIFQAINIINWGVDQAKLEDKGKINPRPDFVITSTNQKDLHAHAYFSCPSAFLRRLPVVIQVRVKPEYATKENTLDSQMCDFDEDGYPDYWEWSVELVQPRSIKSADKTAIYTNPLGAKWVPMEVFLPWFAGLIRRHREDQFKVTSSMDCISRAWVCTQCDLPNNLCDCRRCETCWKPTHMCSCHTTQSLSGVVSTLSTCLYFVERCMNLILKVPLVYALFKTILGWQRIQILYTTINQRCQRLRDSEPVRVARRLGDRIQQFDGYPSLVKGIATILSSAVAIGLIVKYFRKTYSHETQGGESTINTGIGEEPQPCESERPAVWFKDQYQLSTFDVSEKTLSNKGKDDGEILKLFERNIINVVSENDDAFRIGTALCVTGQIYVTNNHVMLDNITHVNVVADRNSDHGVTPSAKYRISECDIKRYPDRDLCFFVLRNRPNRKSVVEYMAKESYAARTHGLIVSRNADGGIFCRSSRFLYRSRFVSTDKINIDLQAWWSKVDIPTRDGDCGSMYVAKSELGPVIIGLHVAGDRNDAIAVPLDQDIVNEAIASFSLYSVQSNEPMLSAPSKERKLGDLHYKSVFRYLETGTADVYGSFLGYKPRQGTRVEKTILNTSLAKNLGFETKFFAPKMGGWQPWRKAAIDLVNPVLDIDLAILDKCKEAFLDEILLGLSPYWLSQLQVYDDFTAINGSAGVTYVDKMPRNTSAGLPFRAPKKNFLRAIEPHRGLQDPVEVDDEIMERVVKIIDAYHNNKRAMPVYCGNLKDEPKKDPNKVRVFCGGPMDQTIVVRKYLLSFTRVVQNNRFLFESAPGTIAQSSEWQDIYDHLTQHGKHKIVAGDYKAFDKRMPASVILAAFEIIEKLCKLSGNFTENDLKVIRGIAYDTAFPLVDFNGDLVEFHGSNPSGHPLTVHINGLVNALYVRYTYYQSNPEKEVASFKQNVSLITYGDDNAMGVSDKCPWFHHTSIQYELGKVGITYTMADKEAESVPYITIDECSFLKRYWRYCDEMSIHLAPLEHDSIEKMLMVWVRSKTITKEEQAIAVIESAINEYFFYGKDEFEAKRSALMQVAEECGILSVARPSTFPTWDELELRFWSNSSN